MQPTHARRTAHNPLDPQPLADRARVQALYGPQAGTPQAAATPTTASADAYVRLIAYALDQDTAPCVVLGIPVYHVDAVLRSVAEMQPAVTLVILERYREHSKVLVYRVPATNHGGM